MAESTLSLKYTDFYAEVADYLGYGRADASHTTEVDAIIQAGYRGFLYPPPVTGRVHLWSFLRPVTTLIAWRTATGTATVSGGGKTITDSTNKPFLPSMISQNVVFDESGKSYAIDTYTSTSVVTVTTDASAENGKPFTITCDGQYHLPDDFGGIVGPLTYAAGTARIEIPITNEAVIRQYRQANAGTGVPASAAVRVKPFVETSGPRYELLLFPLPCQNYTLTYRYNVIPGKLTSDKYPICGTQHCETLMESMLAVAEQRRNDEAGIHQQKFMQLLAASIALDQQVWAAETFGYNYDYSNGSRYVPHSNVVVRYVGRL